MKIDEELKEQIAKQANPAKLLEDAVFMAAAMLGMSEEDANSIVKNIVEENDLQEIFYKSLIDAFKRKDRLKKWLELEGCAREAADNFADVLDSLASKEFNKYLPAYMKLQDRITH